MKNGKPSPYTKKILSCMIYNFVEKLSTYTFKLTRYLKKKHFLSHLFRNYSEIECRYILTEVTHSL